MTIWICGLLLLGLAGAAHGQLVTVLCIGTESGGWGGPLKSPYCYEVITSPGLAMSSFQVGDHTGSCPGIYALDPVGNPLVGWVGACGTPGSELDFDEKTPHNLISPGPSGSCPAITLWQGPAITGGGFFFGHFSTLESHDVGWTVGPMGLKENWSAPVGAGFGPVHAPIPEPSSALLLILGICALRRRRHKA